MNTQQESPPNQGMGQIVDRNLTALITPRRREEQNRRLQARLADPHHCIYRQHGVRLPAPGDIRHVDYH